MHDRARGQAIVEFGLVAMLFFTLLFGIFDFGMLLNDWISATSAASVGARQAAVGACLEGPVSDPATCPTGETSVIGAVMDSAPMLATGGNCQNPPPAQPPAAAICVGRVDIAVVDLTVPGAYCRDAELWVNSEPAQNGSTSTVIKTLSTTWTTTLVGHWVTFTDGTNANTSQMITANTATTITVAPGFSKTPNAGDKFDVAPATLTLIPITSYRAQPSISCSAATQSPQINDALKVVVSVFVDLPVPLPGLTDMYAESSSTVRYEGAYVQ